MIHTVYLDDEFVEVKEFPEEMLDRKRGVRAETHVFDNAVPEEYMTSEEFRKQAIIKVNKFCDKHGIL